MTQYERKSWVPHSSPCEGPSTWEMAEHGGLQGLARCRTLLAFD